MREKYFSDCSFLRKFLLRMLNKDVNYQMKLYNGTEMRIQNKRTNESKRVPSEIPSNETRIKGDLNEISVT